jgi:uncharacterized membrane protein YdjX (TVP38/TMEM64 family)
MLRIVSKYLRALFLIIWLGVILAGVLFYISDPAAFTAENIAGFLQRSQGEIWLIYFLMSALRGFTLLPSTPLIIAGTLLFPQQSFFVLFVSIFGILISSTILYFFSELIGFAEYFETNKPSIVQKIKERLERPTGFLFVAAWSFFPLVPTDAICYVAGTARMKFSMFLTAIFLGEVILCSCYIFLGGSLIKFRIAKKAFLLF